MNDVSEGRLVLAFARNWDLSKTMPFEAVYHENLRLSLKDKKELLGRGECVWLYDASTQELIGETYGFPVREAFNIIKGEGFDDVQPYWDQKAIYICSTTILPKFQGRGLGRVLKAFLLGVASQAGFRIVLGHARSGASVQLNEAFGAKISTVHHDWYGSGETYYFYTLELEKT